MSQFVKYQHVERLGLDATLGLLDGTVYIFPKIDGTNGSVWYEDGVVRCGKRNQMLGPADDNQGFKSYVQGHLGIQSLLKARPELRLYGEWLVPHTIKAYQPDAWRKFYVFDVMVCNEDKYEEYMSYDVYKPLLEEYHIEYIPCMAVIENARPEMMPGLCDKNTFLMKEGIGEGIVIKRYDFVNKYGHTVWGKVVTQSFKWGNYKAMGAPKLSGGIVVEQAIVDTFVTLDLVNKEYEKFSSKSGGWESKYIHALLGCTYYALITEEMWSILKKFKAHPVIDFRLLERLTITRIKELRSDLFTDSLRV